MNFFNKIVAAIATYFATLAAEKVQTPPKSSIDQRVADLSQAISLEADAAEERAASLEAAASLLAQNALRERRFAKHADNVSLALTDVPTA